MSCKLPFYITAKFEVKPKGTGAHTVAVSRSLFLSHCWSSFPCVLSPMCSRFQGAQLEITNQVSYKISFLLSNTNGYTCSTAVATAFTLGPVTVILPVENICNVALRDFIR